MRQKGDHPEKKDAQEIKAHQGQHHKGGPNGSSKTAKKHEKDESGGADHNTTKKQGNSI
ncbi:hypothetical protein [Chryseosolibacter indicus]|uniref:Uncharacterized protein n=1 Tax=Chryseosolibacter indicus TaxID=2782351 RepID=A0ABS5VWF0_9BACT|nr:hypothetical protein [Chryseosolibacter indicus]MBT1705157.1 hypothetical protein [Chryseosolibacter indicus]